MIPQTLSLFTVYVVKEPSELMSLVATCHQLKSLSLESYSDSFIHEDIKVLLDNLPQLVTMEMMDCYYEDGDIDASVNVSCGIDTSVKPLFRTAF